MNVKVFWSVVAAALVCGSTSSLAGTTWGFAREDRVGDPSYRIVLPTDGTGTGWQDKGDDFLPGLGTVQGFWDLGSGGTMSMSFQPGIADLYLWADVTYFVGDIDSTFGLDAFGAPTVTWGGGTPDDVTTINEKEVDTGGWWRTSRSMWGISHPISSADVVITANNRGGLIDSVVIGSSPSPVPEPGTVVAALSVLAPAGLLFRRKKRQA